MKPSLTVKTIAEQTGFRRAMPVTLCQNFDLLRQVCEYDFDLSNEEFQDYARRRGVLYKAGVPSTDRWLFTANHQTTRAEFFERYRYATDDSKRCFANLDASSPRAEQRYRFTDQELETHWQIMLAAKGALQDCWELWLNQQAA